jgi:hypothetical protein
VRSAEDIDEQALSYAEIKALATGNPYIKEKMDLDLKAARLKVVRGSFLDQKYALEDRLIKGFPEQIKKHEETIDGLTKDIHILESHRQDSESAFCPMEVGGASYKEPKKAGEALLDMCKKAGTGQPVPIGSYRGFEMQLHFDSFGKEYVCTLVGSMRHKTGLGMDARGNITRIDNMIAALPGKLAESKERLDNTLHQIEMAKEEVKKPFPQEDELKGIEKRLAELNTLLNLDEKSHDDADIDIQPEEEIEAPVRVHEERER